MKITRRQAETLYGTGKALAKALGYEKPNAIYMRAMDEPLLEVHYLRLRYELKPEAFDADGRFIGITTPPAQGMAA